jgi:hypothetical protein
MRKIIQLKIIFLFSFCFLLSSPVFAKDPTYKWTKVIGGTGTDLGSSVAIDSLDNVYLVGSFSETVNFNPESGIDLKTSEGNDDIFFSKYNSLGDHLWTKNIGGSSYDRGLSIAIDSENNIFIAGFFEETVDFDSGSGIDSKTSNGSEDVFLTKYSSSGNYQWTKTFGGTNSDYCQSLMVDGENNIYMAGHFIGTVDFDTGSGVDEKTSNGAYDVFITKYSSSGNYQWTKTFGGTGWDWGNSITLDSQNHIYIAGFFNNTVDFDPGIGTDQKISVGSDDIFIVKFDTQGNYYWARTVGGIGSDMGNSIAIDSSDNIYISGGFSDTADFDPGTETDSRTSNGSNDIFLTKYDEQGNCLWTKTTGGAGSDFSRSVEINRSDNVYIAGTFNETVDFNPESETDSKSSIGSYDSFITKYDFSGNYLWTKISGGTSMDLGVSIVADSQGNIYTNGYFNSDIVDFDPESSINNKTSNGGLDIFLTRFNDDTIAPDDNPNKINLTFGSEDSLKKTETIYLSNSPKLSGTISDAKNGTLYIYQRNTNGGKHLIETVSIDENGNWDYNLKDIKKNKTITLYFKTIDDNFNESSFSSPYRIYLDKNDPTFDKTKTLNNSIINNTSRTINFQATDDETAVSFYKLKLIQKNKVIKNWRKQKDNFYIVPQDVPLGTYILLIRAYDKAGNKAEKRVMIIVK